MRTFSAEDRERLFAERERQRRAEESARRREWFVNQFGKRYATSSLESFECYGALEDRQRQGAVLDSVREYLSELLSNVKHGSGLVLFGPVGTGKDHLMFAGLIAAYDAGMSVRWLNGMEFFAEVRDRIDSELSELAFARELSAPDILAISDPIPPWGQVSQFQAALLFQIIDRRYRDLKPVWATMNVASGSEAADRMGVAVTDRLKESRNLKLFCNWPSYRTK